MYNKKLKTYSSYYEENCSNINGLLKEKQYSLNKIDKKKFKELAEDAQILSDNKFLRFLQENKKNLLIGSLAAAGTAGLGYGGYKLYKHFKDKKNKKEGDE